MRRRDASPTYECNRDYERDDRHNQKGGIELCDHRLELLLGEVEATNYGSNEQQTT